MRGADDGICTTSTQYQHNSHETETGISQQDISSLDKQPVKHEQYTATQLPSLQRMQIQM